MNNIGMYYLVRHLGLGDYHFHFYEIITHDSKSNTFVGLFDFLASVPGDGLGSRRENVVSDTHLN